MPDQQTTERRYPGWSSDELREEIAFFRRMLEPQRQCEDNLAYNETLALIRDMEEELARRA